MLDILLKNARIIDGTGNPLFRGDVGIYGETIKAVGELADQNAHQVLDAEDLILSPGFVDAHVHTETVLLAEPQHEASLFQGVTTQIIGQDGLGFAPASRSTLEYMNGYAAGINGRLYVDRDYLSVKDFLSLFDGRISNNIAYLIPQGCLRMEAMGLEDRTPTTKEIERMQVLAKRGMREGAIGISTGLEYIPCAYADTDELVNLGKAVKPWNGVFVVHRRNYPNQPEKGVEEVLTLGEKTGIGVHISHLTGKAEFLLPVLDAGRSRGVDITFDAYPYMAGCTTLAKACLPIWVQAGGVKPTVERLKQAEVRDRLGPWLSLPEDEWDQIYLSYIARAEWKIFEGLTPLESARVVGKNPAEFVCDLLIDSEMEVGCVEMYTRGRTEEDLLQIISHPAHMAGSDGVFFGSHPHPRGWGTFARYLAVYTRELGIYDLESAVRHLSSHAALRFGIHDRGLIREGYAADIVIFDPNTICDLSTYRDSRRIAQGVVHVLVNGKFVLRNGQLTEALPGRSLRSVYQN